MGLERSVWKVDVHGDVFIPQKNNRFPQPTTPARERNSGADSCTSCFGWGNQPHDTGKNGMSCIVSMACKVCGGTKRKPV